MRYTETLKKSLQAVPFVALKTGNEERKWNTNFLLCVRTPTRHVLKAHTEFSERAGEGSHARMSS